MIKIHISGPRGAGKTVLAHAILKMMDECGFAASVTKDGRDGDLVEIDNFDPVDFIERQKIVSTRPDMMQLNAMRDDVHARNVAAGWWSNLTTGERIERNDGEMIALMHSELSEALEGVRKSKRDDHLPHRPSVEVEMADTVIRILDYCGGRGLDIGGAVVEKLAYNAKRQDHKRENRLQEGGKKI